MQISGRKVFQAEWVADTQVLRQYQTWEFESEQDSQGH